MIIRGKYFALYLALVSLMCFSALKIDSVSGKTQLHQHLTAEIRDLSLKMVRQSAFHNEPIEVQFMKGKDGILAFNKQVRASDEWLSGFSIQVRNTWNQPIRAMNLVIIVPSSAPQAGGDDEFRGVAQLSFGNTSDEKSRTEFDSVLYPSQARTLSLSPEAYQNFKSVLEMSGPISTVTRVFLSVQDVEFENGDVWLAGSMFAPEPGGRSWIRKDLEDTKPYVAKASYASSPISRARRVDCGFLVRLEDARTCRGCGLQGQPYKSPTISYPGYGDVQTKSTTIRCVLQPVCESRITTYTACSSVINES